MAEIEVLTLIRRGTRPGSARPDYQWWQEVPGDVTVEGLRSMGYEVVDFVRMASLAAELERLAQEFRERSRGAVYPRWLNLAASRLRARAAELRGEDAG